MVQVDKVNTGKIRTAEDILGRRRRRPFKSFSEFYRHYARRSLSVSPEDLYPDTILAPRVNHGRWIIDCPFCSGADFYWQSSPFFFCTSCGNNYTDKVIPVKVTKNKEKIEAILMRRPNEVNRNWELGETIKQLEWENKDRGVK